MKRKRKWWLWLIIAFACMIVAFAIAELTGNSLISIFGWGALGVVGVFAFVLLAGVSFILPLLFRALLEMFISNREKLSIIFGSIGVCAIVIGWIATKQGHDWSLFLVMSGFSMGCLAGAEYQKHEFRSSNEPEGRLGQIPDEIEEG